MKILLTGATGYVGRRLLPVLANQGHEVVCCVRDKDRLMVPKAIQDKVQVIEGDFLDASSLSSIPEDIEAAYYLIHSMTGQQEFRELDRKCAENFTQRINQTQVDQVIYLGGIQNEHSHSRHLDSRKEVESILAGGKFHLTALRAGIIIGSGSASFEIIRDLTEKLPIMIAPKWLQTRCQPIGIADVIQFLTKTLGNKQTYDQYFDIGGQDILSYKEMLLGFAKARGLKRWIFTVPVMTPRLSSYWLYFITSTAYHLAISLVDSMKVEVVAEDDRLAKLLDIQPLGYEAALDRTFQKIKSNQIVSSWKDAFSSGRFKMPLSDFMEVPEFGCLRDQRSTDIQDKGKTLDRIWKIGGDTGWYHVDWLWQIRGFLDKLVGGVGLRRGRTHPERLEPGDSVDFWRVLYANKEEGRLLLFAEMKLPGEAWLEFKVEDDRLVQTATFRPLGVAGRLYWYSILPLHGIVFKGMLNALAA